MSDDQDHFECAAKIGAYMELTIGGAIPHDEQLFPRSVYAQMVHLNAWAMPQNLPEKEAFAQVQTEKERLFASLSIEEIVSEARACVERAK